MWHVGRYLSGAKKRVDEDLLHSHRNPSMFSFQVFSTNFRKLCMCHSKEDKNVFDKSVFLKNEYLELSGMLSQPKIVSVTSYPELNAWMRLIRLKMTASWQGCVAHEGVPAEAVGRCEDELVVDEGAAAPEVVVVVGALGDERHPGHRLPLLQLVTVHWVGNHHRHTNHLTI